MFQTPRWFREFESAVLCRQPKEHPSTIPADSTKNLAALTRDWGVREWKIVCAGSEKTRLPPLNKYHKQHGMLLGEPASRNVQPWERSPFGLPPNKTKYSSGRPGGLVVEPRTH